MARSRSKPPFVAPGVTRAQKRAEADVRKEIKIYSRSSVILSSLIGKTVKVYNGKKFVPVAISDLHVGHKFGEFAPSRVPVRHSGDKKAIKKGGR